MAPPRSSPQGGNGNGGDQSTEIAIIFLIAIVAVPCIIWWTSHTTISAFVQRLRLVEAWLIPFDPLRQDVVRRWVATTPPEVVTLSQIAQSGDVVGHWLGWVAIVVLAGLGAWLAWRSPDWPGRYNKSYTMASLAQQESSLWPTIHPVLGAGLLNVSLDDPVQGMRQTPRAYGHRLKFVVPTASLATLPAEAEPINPREVFLVKRARQVLAKQLGRRWEGIDRLQPHEQALFAAFAAQANYNNEAAQSVINALPDAYLHAVKARKAALITAPGVAGLLTAHGDSEIVKKVLRRHTYVRTVLMALLVQARTKGILPPNWFRWLKTVDRITWYCLTDLGTENASAEAAGVRAHYNAESLIRGTINEPEVDAAIDGFRTYLQEVLDEDEDDE